jgi:hypothetical protein
MAETHLGSLNLKPSLKKACKRLGEWMSHSKSRSITQLHDEVRKGERHNDGVSWPTPGAHGF